MTRKRPVGAHRSTGIFPKLVKSPRHRQRGYQSGASIWVSGGRAGSSGPLPKGVRRRGGGGYGNLGRGGVRGKRGTFANVGTTRRRRSSVKRRRR